MAFENETLDLKRRKNRHWRIMSDMMTRREPRERILAKALASLHDTWRRLLGTDPPLPVPALLEACRRGGRATKGCHPRFLGLMSRLLSALADRDISYTLPNRHRTKAELIKAALASVPASVLLQTVSCARFPQRLRGGARQCGVCMACLLRRQSLFAAGLSESTADTYRYDALGPSHGPVDPPPAQQHQLNAVLRQVAAFRQLRTGVRCPADIMRWLYGTGAVNSQEEAEGVTDLLSRYRDEWLALIRDRQRQGVDWALAFGDAA